MSDDSAEMQRIAIKLDLLRQKRDRNLKRLATAETITLLIQWNYLASVLTTLAQLVPELRVHDDRSGLGGWRVSFDGKYRVAVRSIPPDWISDYL